MTITGYIKEFDGETLTIVAPFSDKFLIEKKQITECEIRLDDGRTISHDQRKKIFALIDDIAKYTRGTAQSASYFETLREMQMLYLIDSTDNEDMRWALTTYYCDLVNKDRFSLSAIDMTTAHDFIGWLIDFCVYQGIPCEDLLKNRCEDIGRYLYACVANRRCAVCGQKADIHHVDSVGSGVDRRKTHHLGKRVQPLCRKHHGEVEQIGQATFDRKYHMDSIQLDEYLCDILKWRK